MSHDEHNVHDSDQTRPAGELLELEIAGVKVKFRWAPAGTFMMGSPKSEQDQWTFVRDTGDNQHEVTLTRGFWIAETPTTQELWQAVMGDNPSHFKDSNQLPVEDVSWFDCQDFVNRGNNAYSDILPSGYKYALPTDAQWEYACRAGTTSPFNFGDILNGDKANCDGKRPYGTYEKGEYKGQTTPVKSYVPNAWGLYDMHGNVWEWCADWYNLKYYMSSSATVDPMGSDSGSGRVLRGGCCMNDAWSCRSANRSYDARCKRNYMYDSSLLDVYGFRLVLAPDSQSQPAQTEEVAVEREYPNGDEPEATREAGAIKTLKIAEVEVNFHWAPSGTFLMGSPEDEDGHYNDEIQHEVMLTQGFWIAETLTTQELWRAVMEDNPSHFKGSNQLPVDSVSWDDCHDFVEKLNNAHAAALPPGYKYAMPTEAQWEYACRAGTTTPFSFGSTLNGDMANCDGSYPYGTDEEGEYIELTTPVKSYAPNPWGLYDMHGNLEEWCADWYGEDYYTRVWASKDPTGPRSGFSHVFRGGSWFVDACCCLSSFRSYIDIWDDEFRFLSRLGFRLVLVPTYRSAVYSTLSVQTEEVTVEREYPNGDEPEATREAGAIKTLKIAGVKVNFHWAPSGTFLMGSPEDEDGHCDNETQHKVMLTQGFWIAETLTTQELWREVMKNNPSYFTGSEQLPVDSVSWDDCHDFVGNLNNAHAAALPPGYRYAMPTESQWEYACRAGTTTPYSFGSTLNGDMANCDGERPYGTDEEGEYIRQTTPVKSYAPNPWGLYDMHGNLEEWCADWYGEDYYTRVWASKDPTGPFSGSSRVMRGGSWSSFAWRCRSASRSYIDQRESECPYYGFRLVLVPTDWYVVWLAFWTWATRATSKCRKSLQSQ